MSCLWDEMVTYTNQKSKTVLSPRHVPIVLGDHPALFKSDSDRYKKIYTPYTPTGALIWYQGPTRLT
jgi:hypothetical protein